MMGDESCSKKRRVVFIGGLADGRMVVEELLRNPRVDLVGVYVLDDAAGGNVSGYISFDDLVPSPTLQKIKRIKEHSDEVASLKPDLVVVVGFSQIIPKAILDVPPLGTIGFHSAELPGRRGCSPLIWAVVDGLEQTAISMFFMGTGIDVGDVIDVERFEILITDQAADVLRKADEATLTLFRRHVDGLLDGTAPRKRQDESLCTYTRKRTFADGEIDLSRPASDVYNLIRALSPPYPMAHVYAGDGRALLIEKARLVDPGNSLPPGRFFPNDPMRQRVLCVVAHPDDEVLGVGTR
jgi:methionyl-tRNA formyltransferase